jgi:hypothetical protein
MANQHGNSETNQPTSILRHIRGALVISLLSVGLAACDIDAPRDDHPRMTCCELEDGDCAASPGAEEAILVLESMGVDLDVTDVELRLPEASEPVGTACLDESPLDLAADAEPSAIDRSTAADALVSEPDVQHLPPVEGRCSIGGGWMCCCVYFGPGAGCGCEPL